VLVLERERRVGRKIEISGGGRCNFTNRVVRSEDFLSANPSFARSALARFGAEDFLARVEARGIAWHEKKAGQLFCDGSARQIVSMLVDDAREAGVEIRVGCAVGEVTRSDRFEIATDSGRIRAEKLVIATGGLSIPKIGATDLGYRIAERFGLPILPTRPGLVPLRLSEDDVQAWGPLAGVSFPAIVRTAGVAVHESVLFTHRGLSGPAILDASSSWRPGEALEIDLFAGADARAAILAAAGRDLTLPNWLAGILPKRLALAWCERRATTRPLRQHSAKELAAIAERLRSWTLHPADTEGYGKAEVTVHGVDTAALSSKTMEARSVPGLHVIGEVVDVTGRLGGFNFQWAWSSGWAAGRAV
jgi:predicted Rossmann fold flavoprotein